MVGYRLYRIVTHSNASSPMEKVAMQMRMLLWTSCLVFVYDYRRIEWTPYLMLTNLACATSCHLLLLLYLVVSLEERRESSASHFWRVAILKALSDFHHSLLVGHCSLASSMDETLLKKLELSSEPKGMDESKSFFRMTNQFGQLYRTNRWE